MNLLEKLKETALSVIPVMVIVLILGLLIEHTAESPYWLGKFFIGGMLLIFGLTIFLLGVDLGIQPMGERCGAALMKKRSLSLLLISAFVIGFIVTIAEPDIQVFADTVKRAFNSVDKMAFTYAIGGGVGFFMMMGILRTILKLPIKLVLLVSYLLLFVAAYFAKPEFVGIAFDSGGATTGPMTVPFIMAIGLGVSAVRSDTSNSFGLTGVTSVGPVLSVLIYSMFVADNAEGAVQALETQGGVYSASSSCMAMLFSPIKENFSHVLHESIQSIAPLFVMFIIFRIFLLKMTMRQMIRVIIGFIYAFIGLFIFLIGVQSGFMQAGDILGQALGHNANTLGGIWYVLLVGTGLLLGAIIVCAEPAVWVLSEQVEQVSGGAIKRKALLIFLSIGTALAIGLAMIRAVVGFPVWYLLLPGYILAMILMRISPDLFTGIAFDSGGVASGPLTSTFVLSFTLGTASGGNAGGNDTFGVIALVAMMPLIAIQFMGYLYSKKKQKVLGHE